MNILLIGSAAENTATAQLLRKSENIVKNIYNWGGNLPSDLMSKNLGLPADATMSQVAKTAVEADIDLVILTTESAILSGVANALQSYRIPCFGPTRVASHFRWDPKYASQIIRTLGIPSTTESVHYNLNDLTDAVMNLKDMAGGIAIRAIRSDGRVQHYNCESVTDIANAIYVLETQTDMGSYTRYYLEKMVHGVRCRYVAMVSGNRVSPIGLSSELRERITSTIAKRLVNELNKDDCPYTGWLVIDLVVNKETIYVGEMSCVPSAEFLNALNTNPEFDFLKQVQQLMQDFDSRVHDNSVEIMSSGQSVVL